MNQFGHPLGGVDVLAALGGAAAAAQALGAYPTSNPAGYIGRALQPTGAAAARALADRFADALNLLDYVLPIDADHTLALTRAHAQAQSLNRAVVIDIPAGLYILNGTIAPTLTGNQAIYLRGAGSAVTVIRQMADADGISAALHNYGPASFQGGAFNVTGITLEMGAAASAGRTALSVSTTGIGGNTGRPLVLDDIAVSSPNTASWASGVVLTNFSNVAYLSRISTIAGAVAFTGVSINGSSATQNYSASIYLRDITCIGGAVGLNLGNYLQGIHIDNYNSVNPPVSINCQPTAGANLEIIITNSYIHGRAIFRPIGPNGFLNSIRMSNNYFDMVYGVNQPGDKHVTFWDCPEISVVNCHFHGNAAIGNITGLYLAGGTVAMQFVGNIFQDYCVTGSRCIEIAPTIANVGFTSNIVNVGTATPISDLGTGNTFVNTNIDGVFYQYGFPGQPAPAPARIQGSLQVGGTLSASGLASFQGPAYVVGNWPAGTTPASTTFSGTGLSVGWNLSGGGGEVDFVLGRQGGAGGLNIYQAAANGALVSQAPIFTMDGSGNVATNALHTNAPLVTVGAWPAGVTTASTSFAPQGLTVGWNLSNGGGEVDLLLGRFGAAGGLNVYSVAGSGALDSPAPILSLSATGALSHKGGIGAFGQTPPATQPARAVTLADVIAVLAGAGLTA